MKEIKQVSRNHYRSEDDSIEIFIKDDGRKVNDKTFSGSWAFSSKHGDMMPHKNVYSIVVNGEYRVREVFEESINEELRKLGYKVVR